MASNPLSGTEGYAEEADRLVQQYESLSFAEVHGSILHLIPPSPATVLDIGAGTGRDAAALAAMGHDVVAVEPTAALRTQAAALHPSPRIEWVDDGLPELAGLAGRAGSFGLILLTAVWMHLDAPQRRLAMPWVARLLRPAGRMILSLRHGPVPAGRRMFDVSAEETIGLAAAEGLGLVLRLDNQPNQLGQAGVYWTRLAFAASEA